MAPKFDTPAVARRRQLLFRHAAGTTLTELLVVLTVFAMLIGVALPNLVNGLRHARLSAASRDLSMRFRALRTDAVLMQRTYGIKFDRSRDYAWGVYRDGNGNGIRSRDIRRGVDVTVRPPRSIGDDYTGVVVGIRPPEPIPRIPPQRGRLDNLHDPVKVGGRSDIISCKRSGSCSSGTVYLSSGHELMSAVRFKGWNAQVQIWDYDARGKKWKRRSR